jgi:mono/diheme cytochrome c family protein
VCNLRAQANVWYKLRPERRGTTDGSSAATLVSIQDGKAASVVLGALTIGAVVLRGAQPAPAPARAAMYTDAQATAGESLYRRSCAGCHGVTLTGGTAPPLAGPAFETSWSDPRVTAADIFFIARTTMPPRASNTLTAQDHAHATIVFLGRFRNSSRQLFSIRSHKSALDFAIEKLGTTSEQND